MDMKLDKETVVKHQFWFLLGGYVLVWLIAVLALKFSAPGKIAAAQQEYKKSKDGLDRESKSPKNDKTFCPPWEAYGNIFDGHKKVIWKQAWDLQRWMYNWPFNKDMSFPQQQLSQDEREEYKRKFYPDQIEQLRQIAPTLIHPAELKGGFDNVFRPQEWKETPTREECWLAQEDYWVKRELVYVIGYALAAQGYMAPWKIDEKEALPEGVDAKAVRRRFRNLNWEITLIVTKDGKNNPIISRHSTIKNVHPGGRVQNLASGSGEGLVFSVHQGKTKASFMLKGEPVPSEKTVPFNSDYAPPTLAAIDWSNTKEPAFISEEFDWYTSPIRRIEAIEIGQQSCRTYTTGLKANDTLAKLDAPKENPEDASKDKDATGADAGGAGAGGAGVPNMGSGSMNMGEKMKSMGAGMAGMMGGMPGIASTPTNVTPNNGIPRNRYLQAPKEENSEEKPSRHLPLAIQLIVDQSHMQDVLLWVANSRLRIQITQVEFRRVHNIKPEEPSEKKGSGSEIRTTPSTVPPMMGGGAMPPGGFGGSMMMRPGGPGGAGGAGAPSMGSGNMRPPMMGGSMNPMMAMMMGKGAGAGNPIMGPGGMSVNPMNRLTGAGAKREGPPRQDDEDLVELTVYGIATLYRCPDAPKTDEQSGQPAPNGQPTAPAAKP
jgi:hypothetical protein